MSDFTREELIRLQERAPHLDRGTQEIVEAICLLTAVIEDSVEQILKIMEGR